MEPAPPYRGEGPHALWHVSEDDSIRRFEPRDGKVWAIDTRHLPLYWFPRECPRATFWADSATTDEDVVRFLGGDRMQRVHLVEPHWVGRMSTDRIVAYRLAAGTFAAWDRFWISPVAVEPLERVELGDLAARHAAAGIELRVTGRLLATWDEIVSSTLDFSGIRLRNARMAAP